MYLNKWGLAKVNCSRIISIKVTVFFVYIRKPIMDVYGQFFCQDWATRKITLLRVKFLKGDIYTFDRKIWGSMVKFVTAGRKKEIKVTFRDGTEIMA